MIFRVGSLSDGLTMTLYWHDVAWYKPNALCTPLILGIFVFITALMRLLGGVKATKILHSALLGNIVKSPMNFFDTTPSGRIVNRFSKDVDTLDSVIPMIVGMFLMCVFQTTSTILVISISTPMFLICIVPLLVFYYFVQVYIQLDFSHIFFLVKTPQISILVFSVVDFRSS